MQRLREFQTPACIPIIVLTEHFSITFIKSKTGIESFWLQPHLKQLRGISRQKFLACVADR